MRPPSPSPLPLPTGGQALGRGMGWGGDLMIALTKEDSVRSTFRGEILEEEKNRRSPVDRRKKPTPCWGWFTFFGQRRLFRRKSDQKKGGYLDRYSHILFFLLVLILSLNILDSLFTMMIIDLGGQEFNPLVRSFIELHGDMFWIWRFVIVSIALVLLYLHHGFILVRRVIIAIGLIYIVIVVYQMYLVFYR